MNTSASLLATESSSRDARWRFFVELIILALFTALTYSNAAPPRFVYDDATFLESTPLASADMADFFTKPSLSGTGYQLPAYRPLTMLTIAPSLPDSPRAAHVINVVLHVATTLMFWLFLRRYLATMLPIPIANAGSFFSALVFGVHPIHAEAVNLVFHRSDILATLLIVFALERLITHLPSRPTRGFGIAAVVFLPALLCKESAATLPVLACLVAWPLLKGETVRERLRQVVPALLFIPPLLVFLIMRAAALRVLLVHVPPAPLAERLQWAGASAYRLASLLIWPHNLRASYEDYVPVSPWVSIPLLIILLTLALAAWRKMAPVAVGILFYFVALLPTTRLIADSSTAAIGDRYAYLPSVGFGIALAYVGARAILRFRSQPARIALAAGAGLLCVVLAAATWNRNRDWRSAMDLWQAEIRAAPNSHAAWSGLIFAYRQEKRMDEAASICLDKQDQISGYGKLHYNCGSVFRSLGRHEEAEDFYRRAVELGYGNRARMNLARQMVVLGRLGEAEQEFRRTARDTRNRAYAHLRLGEGLIRVGKKGEARQELLAALALKPDFPEAQNWLNRIDEISKTETASSEITEGGESSVLEGAARAALVAVLRTEPTGTPVWLAVSEVNPGAQALLGELRGAFAEAGWRVEDELVVPFSIRPGILLLAADPTPPVYAKTVQEALLAAGLEPRSGTNYREYYEEMTRKQADFKGFELAPEQTYVVVLGRMN